MQLEFTTMAASALFIYWVFATHQLGGYICGPCGGVQAVMRWQFYAIRRLRAACSSCGNHGFAV